MREHDEIELRQLRNRQRGFGQPPGRHPQAYVRPVPAVQEIRVGENREARDADEGGGGSDEGDLVGTRWYVGSGIHGSAYR